MSVRKRLSIALPVLAIAALVAPLASAGDPFLTVLAEDDLARAPFARYARMTKVEALTELRERGAIFDEVPAEKAPGVIAPIRLTARLGGVHIHGMLKGEAAQTTPFEIVDARLALSLHDFAGILQLAIKRFLPNTEVSKPSETWRCPARNYTTGIPFWSLSPSRTRLYYR